jgi:sRNA-binding regulator protein Hfq
MLDNFKKIMNKNIKIINIIFIYIFIPSFLFADTIILKNGKTLKGKIINLAQTRISLKLENDQVIEIDKQDILKIQLDKEEPKKQDENPQTKTQKNQNPAKQELNKLPVKVVQNVPQQKILPKELNQNLPADLKNQQKDTIFLKNGKVIKGKITNQSQTKVEIQTEDGNRILLNKEEIRRIQFGPTQNEIELEKRRQEEQKQIEEQRRKQQEEEIRRKQEEEKRLEEERRKQEERKKPKEPIIRRENLEIGYGLGRGNSDLYYNQLMNGIGIGKSLGITRYTFLPQSLSNSGYFLNQSYEFNKRSSNHNLHLAYYYNSWGFGLEWNFSQLGKGIQVNRYGTILGQSFVSISNVENKQIPTNNIRDIWISYDFYRYNFGNRYLLIGIKGGVYSINTKLNYEQNSLDLGVGYEYEKGNLSTKKGELFSLGPSVLLRWSKTQKIDGELRFIGGSTEGLYEYLSMRENFFAYAKEKFNDRVEGVIFKLRYSQLLSDQWYWYVSYSYNQINYFVKKSKNRGYKRDISIIQVDNTSFFPSNFFFPRGNFLDLLPFIQKGKDRLQTIDIGIVYFIDFKK